MSMIRDVSEAGYKPHIIIMVRAAWIVRKAQITSHSPTNEDESQSAIEEAYLWIFGEIQKAHNMGYGASFYMIPYGELVREPHALTQFCEMLNLPIPEFEFRNGNQKHYESDCSNSNL